MLSQLSVCTIRELFICWHGNSVLCFQFIHDVCVLADLTNSVLLLMSI